MEELFCTNGCKANDPIFITYKPFIKAVFKQFYEEGKVFTMLLDFKFTLN